jgi:hypothetical protein
MLLFRKHWASWEEDADRNNVLRTRIWRNVVSADEWWVIVLYRSTWTVQKLLLCRGGAASKTPHEMRDGCDAMRQGMYQDSASPPKYQKFDHNFPHTWFPSSWYSLYQSTVAPPSGAPEHPPPIRFPGNQLSRITWSMLGRYNI